MKTNTQKATAKPPIDRIRVGLLNANIWERQTEKGTFHTVSLERRYRDSDGKWQSTHSYRVDDLPNLVEVANRVRTRILELQQSKAA